MTAPLAQTAEDAKGESVRIMSEAAKALGLDDAWELKIMKKIAEAKGGTSTEKMKAVKRIREIQAQHAKAEVTCQEQKRTRGPARRIVPDSLVEEAEAM